MAGDGSGTTKATAARRTADNGASYEDNGIGLSSEYDGSGLDDVIGGSISLARGSK